MRERKRIAVRITSVTQSTSSVRLDAPRGFEPRLTESESVVLPLDDGAPMGGREIESGLQTVNADGPFRLALALRSAIRLNAT